MKRIYSVLIGMISIFLLIAFIGYSKKNIINGDNTETPRGEAFLSYEGVKIYPWEKDGDWYFFLPSYFDWSRAELTVLNGELQIDGKIAEFSSGGGIGEQSYDIERRYPYHFAWGEANALLLQSSSVLTA